MGVNVIATSSSADKAKDFEWFSKVTYVPHDLATSIPDENLYKKFKAPDLLIHLAWAGLPNYKKRFHFEHELPNQYNFLKKLVEDGLKDMTIAGTCYEYGMQEGELSEKLPALPTNSYAIAKNCLRIFLEQLQLDHPFSLKWTRLFYMYGKGQNPNSILAQLQTALDQNLETFNMSGGEQIRDYLPVEQVAKNIVSIALQNKVTGIINCASNQPITIKELVENYLQKTGSKIKLNLGFYPYPDYEPFIFYGNNQKLKSITK